jgi:nucleoside-diphosphate-sugar epimerase
MRILFIGGTRFIGLSAVQHLSDAGHDVTVFHRGETKVDMNDLEDFTDQFKQLALDVIVHMVLIQESDGLRVMKVFKGIAKRIIGISSCDVYLAYGRINGTEPGDPLPVPINEDDPLREELYPYREMINNDPEHRLYNYDKIPIEKAILSDPDMPGTVLRLPMVHGPRDYQRRLVGYLKRMDDNRPAILITKEFAAWRNTRGYIDDVGQAIALAATDDRAAGRIYNVAEQDGLTETEWIQAIADVVGWKGKIVPVDADKLPGSFSVHGQDLVMDTSRIRAELGYTETLSRAEGIRRTIEWDRANSPEEFPLEDFDYETEDKILAELDGE